MGGKAADFPSSQDAAEWEHNAHETMCLCDSADFLSWN